MAKKAGEAVPPPGRMMVPLTTGEKDGVWDTVKPPGVDVPVPVPAAAPKGVGLPCPDAVSVRVKVPAPPLPVGVEEAWGEALCTKVGDEGPEGEGVERPTVAEGRGDAVGLGVKEPPTKVGDANGVEVEEGGADNDAPPVSVEDPVAGAEWVPPTTPDGVAPGDGVGVGDSVAVCTPLSVRLGVFVAVRALDSVSVDVEPGLKVPSWLAVLESEGTPVR